MEKTEITKWLDEVLRQPANLSEGALIVREQVAQEMTKIRARENSQSVVEALCLLNTFGAPTVDLVAIAKKMGAKINLTNL